MKSRYIKELPRALVIGFSIFSIIILIQYLNGYKIELNNKFKYTFIYTFLYSTSLHFANTFLFISLDKYFATDRFSKKRLFVGFISSFIVSMTVIFLIRILTTLFIENETLAYFFENENLRDYVTAITFTFIVLLIIHMIYLYKWYQENKVTEQKIIAGTASAKFESLKNQIDPHFLFNSLNVLSSLIEENPENAQKFTTSLSKVYRYVLEQKDKDLVSVEEELSFAKTYMNLLKMRFENSLTYEIPTEEIPTEFKVVPLSLQLLLENTVKHNVVSEQKPLHIKIFIEHNYLCIENNFQKKEVLGDRQGVGLQNIISRYAIISKQKVIIEQNEQIFKVKIPILDKQITFMETRNSYAADSAYFRAKKRVDELKAFYGNLISYCIVIPILIFINLKFSSQFYWFWFPLFGWGFGLAMHAIEAFGYSSKWEERKIQALLNKQKKF
jgi:sensor histidine kinase YesM